jgi:DNA repair exonuclease SbcCD ATPase subunit
MAPTGSLDSIEQLRTELAGLLELKLVQSDAPLERRGVEIDHNLYEAREGQKMTPRTSFDDEPAPISAASGTGSAPAVQPAPAAPLPSSDLLNRISALETACADLRAENRELREQIDELRNSLADLRRALGA